MVVPMALASAARRTCIRCDSWCNSALSVPIAIDFGTPDVGVWADWPNGFAAASAAELNGEVQEVVSVDIELIIERDVGCAACPELQWAGDECGLKPETPRRADVIFVTGHHHDVGRLQTKIGGGHPVQHGIWLEHARHLRGEDRIPRESTPL